MIKDPEGAHARRPAAREEGRGWYRLVMRRQDGVRKGVFDGASLFSGMRTGAGHAVGSGFQQHAHEIGHTMALVVTVALEVRTGAQQDILHLIGPADELAPDGEERC